MSKAAADETLGRKSNRPQLDNQENKNISDHRCLNLQISSNNMRYRIEILTKHRRPRVKCKMPRRQIQSGLCFGYEKAHELRGLDCVDLNAETVFQQVSKEFSSSSL